MDLLTARPFITVALLLLFFSAEWKMPFMAPAPAARSSKTLWLSRFHNGMMTVINALLVAVLVPLSLYAFASDNYISAWHGIDQSQWLSFMLWQILCLIVLDLAIYAQHIASHKIPLLWRIHRVHHTETHFNTTTALRFHFLEIGFSLAYKMGLLLVLCPHPLTVIIFEIILNGMALFNHSNMKLPVKIEHTIRKLLVTPAMHRSHHSIHRHETDSNYGFNLSVWDKIFNTYTHKSQQNDADFQFGIGQFDTEKSQRFWFLLWLPFKK